MNNHPPRQVNQELGEIGGVFVSKQPSDTDMGAKERLAVATGGEWWWVSLVWLGLIGVGVGLVGFCWLGLIGCSFKQ